MHKSFTKSGLVDILQLAAMQSVGQCHYNWGLNGEIISGIIRNSRYSWAFLDDKYRLTTYNSTLVHYNTINGQFWGYDGLGLNLIDVEYNLFFMLVRDRNHIYQISPHNGNISLLSLPIRLMLPKVHP